MDAAKPKGFSATLAADVGMRVKVIAHQENRSASNVIEGAVKVFTLFPKDVRDLLLDAAADKTSSYRRFKELSRTLAYQDAMRRLDKALDAAAQEISVTRTADDYDNAVVVDSGP